MIFHIALNRAPSTGRVVGKTLALTPHSEHPFLTSSLPRLRTPQKQGLVPCFGFPARAGCQEMALPGSCITLPWPLGPLDLWMEPHFRPGENADRMADSRLAIGTSAMGKRYQQFSQISWAPVMPASPLK